MPLAAHLASAVRPGLHALARRHGTAPRRAMPRTCGWCRGRGSDLAGHHPRRRVSGKPWATVLAGVGRRNAGAWWRMRASRGGKLPNREKPRCHTASAQQGAENRPPGGSSRAVPAYRLRAAPVARMPGCPRGAGARQPDRSAHCLTVSMRYPVGCPGCPDCLAGPGACCHAATPLHFPHI